MKDFLSENISPPPRAEFLKTYISDFKDNRFLSCIAKEHRSILYNIFNKIINCIEKSIYLYGKS